MKVELPYLEDTALSTMERGTDHWLGNIIKSSHPFA